MWSLQYFVNQKLKIIPKVKNVKKFSQLGTDEKFEVRKVLFADVKLIDEFVQENSQQFSQEKLLIVSGWKNFIAGKFYIERFLKKYTIFINGEDVYAVLGLYDGLDEIIHRSYLPAYVEAILLPFNGKIIYDGLLYPYNIFFGNGIIGDLKECYMTAKQNNRIIRSIEKQDGKEKKLLNAS